MLDWLTLKLPVTRVADQEALREYDRSRPRLARYCPMTGEVEWEVSVRDSSRSDTHGVTVHVGAQELEIAGSPARSAGYPDNVFGHTDICRAARDHINAAQQLLGFSLPGYLDGWRVSRVDVTRNYDMGGLPEVRQALAYLRQADGGRYKVRAQAETVYWSPGSPARSGKAYAKGPHLEYMQRRAIADVPEWKRNRAQGLLRLELRLGRVWWQRLEKAWHELTAEDFHAEHHAYFAGLIGTAEITDMSDIRRRIDEVAPTPGQGAAAYNTWLNIKTHGYQTTKENMSRPTWYRHKKILNDAGLGWGDIGQGDVSPVRLNKRTLVLEKPVERWEDLGRAA